MHVSVKFRGAVSAILAAIMLAGCFGCSGPTESAISSSLPSTSSQSTVEPAADIPKLNVVTDKTSAEFKEYYEINSDFIGRFEIPALGLSEISVTAPDNEYYLRRNIYREYRYLGILYYDFRNLNDGEFDLNNIIYGHNVGKSKYSDDMFGKLVKYREGDTYLTADVFKFTALNGYTYYFRLFSGYAASGSANGDKYFYITTDFEENKSFHYTDMRRYDHYTGFINTIKSRSDFSTDLEVEFYDKILTLVTCVYDYEDCRYVLHAKLLHTDEVESLLAEHPEYAVEGEVIGNPAPY